MITRVHAGLGAAAFLAGIACHGRPRAAPVPLEGPAGDVASLAGTWTGTYWSEGSGGHGRVAFRLSAGKDTAYGQVEMTFSPVLRLHQTSGDTSDLPLVRTPCTTLDIAMVRVQGPRVRGTLRPYWNPDCDCRTSTVFEGELAQGRIAGSFTSRRETQPATVVTGRWLVEREPE